MFGCSLKKCLVWGKRSDLGICHPEPVEGWLTGWTVFMATNGAMRQGEENMTRTLFGNVIMVVLAAATLFAATGCSGGSGNSNPNPQSSWLQDDDMPDPTPVGKKAKPGLMDRLSGAAGGAAASGAAGKVMAGGWMFWAAIVCLVAGGLLLGFRVWGPGAIVAGIGLVLAALQWGVGFGFRWFTAIVGVWIILWAVSLMTRFPWDNYIIYLGSVAFLLLSALGQVGVGLPGLTWGVFQALLVFAVAPALWRNPPIPARWLIMGGLWLLLLIAH